METLKYRTKIDWWLGLLLVGLAVVPVLLVLAIVLNWSEAVVPLAVSAGLILMLFAVFILPGLVRPIYILDERGLTIMYGFAFDVTIPYERIVSIEESRNALSSMSFSLDRIKVRYKDKKGRCGWTTISPKNKQEFMQVLQDRISGN
ncbi:MAG: PH domain-containing protein [Firmicutes bacterium]|nr:PH domain-containing protein [Bacillota bacterium]